MDGLYKKFFLHVDILIMLLLFISGTSVILWQKVNLFRLLFIIIGALIFAISEYFTHRFLFHIKAPNNPFLLKMLKRLHYDHHTYPDDLKLLFLPLWYSFPNFFILLAIFYFFNNDYINTISFGVGLIGMLLVYEWKHYVAHRPIKPRTRFGRWIKKIHILHHYKNENYWFGVSTPLADFIFGTYKNEKEVETSKTAKNLEKMVR